MEPRKKSKQIPIGFTERHREMIEQIMDSKGYPSIASVVQQAIIEMHGSVFKDYVMAKKARAELPAIIPGRVDGETKKSQQTDKLMGLAHRLGGSVAEKNGVMMVKYFTYNRRNRYEQEVPLDTMSEQLIKKQYFPSEEDVKKLQEAKKVNY